MRTYGLFIDGAWRATTDTLIDVVDPASGEVVAKVASASAADISDALEAARRAASSWGRIAPAERGAILRRAATILKGKVAAASLATSKEQGKTPDEAAGEFKRAIETLVWNGEQAEALCAPSHLTGGRVLLHAPAGIVAAFSPWNYPAVLSARKLAPPLAAGCPVILKAAEESPAAAVAIVEALSEAGAPRGVVALLFGHPPTIAQSLLSSKHVRVASFTGSTSVGKTLMAQAAQNLQSCVLELGGHAPVIVFDDVDVAKVAQAIADYKFESAGQSCNAPSRVFVQRAVFETFLQEMTSIANGITVGAGDARGTVMGPVIGQRAIDRMNRLTTDAVGKGARILAGGRRLDVPGFFWPPTILADVTADAEIMSEEPFGPILPIVPFDTISEALELANATDYGLASYVFSENPETRAAMVSGLSVGSVSLNVLKGVSADAPNPGLGDSGIGYEGGKPGFREFQTLKLINVAPSIAEGV